MRWPINPFRRQSRLWLVTLLVLTIAIVGFWTFRTLHWYSVGYPQAIQQKRQWLITQANHGAIQQACELMLNNPHHYPQRNGDSFPQNLPSVLASLGASAIVPSQNHVLIIFDRHSMLWVTRVHGTASPPAPGRPAQLLAPGVWML